uniref:Collagen alpha-1(XX) chain n=1 Tax=Apteryx owenii TaxID=8824 RepID=A0A8B9NT82_APTOW
MWSGRLKLTVLSEDRLQMKWKETEGNINGYKVRVKPMAGDSEQEVMLKTKTPKATVAGLSPTKEYTLQVYVLNGSQEALFAKRKFVIEELKNASQTRNNRRSSGTMLADGPICHPDKALYFTFVSYLKTQAFFPPFCSFQYQTLSPSGSQFQCDTSAMTDIILLVDGSWSIGRNNFKLIKEFLSTLISPFNIGQDKIRVGLSQYSSDPRTEWDLNTYTTRDEVLEAMRNLRLQAGKLFSQEHTILLCSSPGLALTHVLEQNLKPESGARLEAEKLVILLTDGKSQDDANLVAQTLKNLGIEIFAIGVKNADEAELKQVASEPLELTVYNVLDFPLLSSLVGRLTQVLCTRIKGKRNSENTGEVKPTLCGPTDLKISAVTSKSMHLTWNPPLRPPKKYRIVYYPSRGGIHKEVILDGAISSLQLANLTSHTEYLVSVFAIYDTVVGDGLRGVTSTCRSILPHSSSSDSLCAAISIFGRCSELGWTRPQGTLSNLLICFEQGIGPETFRGPFSPVSFCRGGCCKARTPLGPPRYLSFSEISHASVRVSWEAASQTVKAHRVTYVSSRGSNTGEVEVPGTASSAVLRPLSSFTQYFISVRSTYDEGDSSPITGNVTTLKVPPPRALKVTELSGNNLQLQWEAVAASDVVVYQIRWSTLSGEKSQELSVAGNVATTVLPSLQKNTDYKISMWAYYKDGARSDTVSVQHRTNSRSPPTNLFINSETPTSLQIHWKPPDGRIQHYKITYSPVSDNSVMASGKSSSVTLQSLLPDRAYKVTVSAVHNTGESESMSTTGRTGIDMMEAFGLVEKEYASIKGVAMEPFIFSGSRTYTLFKDTQLTQRTSDVHLFAIPPEHTISILLRLLPETSKEPFAVWQITDEDFQPLLGVILDSSKKSLTYFNHDYKADLQEVSFDQQEVKKIFYGSFHKVHVAVSHFKIKLYLDCKKIAEKPINTIGSISTAGFIMLGKVTRTRGPRSGSASFQLQSLRIVCNSLGAEEDRCCDLPALRDEETCPTLAPACTCTSGLPGLPGPPGPPVSLSSHVFLEMSILYTLALFYAVRTP